MNPGTPAKIVNNFNEITIGDIPTNGLPGFFIKADYSEIQSRRWSEDGRVVAISYKVQPEAEPQPDPMEDIYRRLDAIEEKLEKKPTTTRKKEVEE